MDIYAILLTISGTLIIILLSVIGFFIARLINDVKSNMTNIGKNKGSLELIRQKQESDILRVEKTTQLEIQALSKQVSGLATSVESLVGILTAKNEK